MKCIKSIQKPPLPKEYRYALRSSQLDSFLYECGYGIPVHLYYWMPEMMQSVLEARYWPPDENVGHERVYIRVGAVPRARAADTRRALQDRVLPELKVWLDTILRLPGDSPLLHNRWYFSAVYKSGKIGRIAVEKFVLTEW